MSFNGLCGNHVWLVAMSDVLEDFKCSCLRFRKFDSHLVGSFSACFVPVERMVSAYITIVNSNIELREPIPAKALLIS